MSISDNPFKILIADDEESLRSIIAEVLGDQGYQVETAVNGKQALDRVYAGGINVVITDIRMPEMTGIELLEKIKQFDKSIEVVIMTSFASIDTAIKAIRLGAYDYLTKPFEDLNIISTVIDRTVGKLKLELEVRKLLAALKLKNQQVQSLYKHSTALFNTLKREEILQQSVQALSEFCSGAETIFYAYDQQAGLLKAQYGFVHEPLQSAELAFRPAVQLATAEAVPANNAALAAHAGLRQQMLSGAAADKGWLIPLFAHEQLLGVYSVLSANTPLTTEVQQLAQQYLGNIGIQLEKARLHAQVEALATRDGLTDLYNRRHFQTTFQSELDRARRFNKALSVILFDVDNFKHYNDTNGHPAGDALLKGLAKVFRDTSRNIDICARYGGEEFVAILIETNREGAGTRAENLRKAIAAQVFPHEEKQPLGDITISVGFAEFPSDGGTVEELLEGADQGLYKSKKGGRNRVTAAPPAAERTAKTS